MSNQPSADIVPNERHACAGLLSTDNRKLSADELAELQHRRRQCRRKGLIWLLLTPFWPAFGLGIGFLLWLIEHVTIGTEAAGKFMSVALVIIGLYFGCAISLLKARDSFRYGRVLRRAIRAGNVRQFVGWLTADTWDDEVIDDVWWRLIDRGLIEAKLPQSLTLELYPHDDYPYRVNETLIRELWPVYVEELEPSSEAEQER